MSPRPPVPPPGSTRGPGFLLRVTGQQPNTQRGGHSASGASRCFSGPSLKPDSLVVNEQKKPKQKGPAQRWLSAVSIAVTLLPVPHLR